MQLPFIDPNQPLPSVKWSLFAIEFMVPFLLAAAHSITCSASGLMVVRDATLIKVI